MLKAKPIILAALVPAVAIGWYLFRPELLFVNSQVNEKISVDMTLSSGDFTSYAHETTGTASLVKSKGTTYLSLSNFHTSNGPDVHVYLVKGKDASGEGVSKNGFLDLGTIKGNIGDQSYAIPATADLDAYGSVAIWCKRFSVGFGGATLAGKEQSFRFAPTQSLASFAETITVTAGSFKGSVKGKASITETEGKRFVNISLAKAGSGGVSFRLVKKETLKPGAFPADAAFVDLGTDKAKSLKVSIGKELDLWLYRSVAAIDNNTKKIIASVDLRSAQEKSKPTFSA